MQDSNQDQYTIVLRIKLDNLSLALKKLAQVFSSIESETSISLVEPQIINRLLGMANSLKELKSLDENEGEIFVVFLKNIAGVIQSIGILLERKVQLNSEQSLKILKAFRNLEDQTKELLPLIVAIDEQRKEHNFESFGGLLQKVIDTIQEKRHFIMR